MVIWLCEIRTVGWVRYHCFSVISDGFCSAHARVKLRAVMEGEQTFFFVARLRRRPAFGFLSVLL